MLAKLATVLSVPVDSLHARVDDKRYSPLLPIPLAEDVPEATVMRIAEQQDDFPGVEAKEVALRVYPFGSRAAHVLGYVGAINDTEYASLKGDGYTLEDQVGKDGVEKIFEKDLRGTPGSITLEVDSAGRVLRELSRTDAIPGRDVQLTIDLSLQALAEDALAKELLNARTHTPKDNPNHFAAPAGSVVVLDPTNGSVVAMASYPTFDPRRVRRRHRSRSLQVPARPRQQLPAHQPRDRRPVRAGLDVQDDHRYGGSCGRHHLVRDEVPRRRALHRA